MSCPYECYQNCMRCLTNCEEKFIYEKLKDVPDNYVINEDYPGYEEDTNYEELGLADCLPEDF